MGNNQLLVLEEVVPSAEGARIPVKQKADSSEARDELWAVRLGTKAPK